MRSIYEFVLRGGQTVTAGQMNAFLPKLTAIREKAETFSDTQYPNLGAQVNFLCQYAEQVLTGQFASADLSAVTETIFALGYLLNDVDIIPDDVPGKGLSDDAAVLAAALGSHEEEFRAFAAKSGADVSQVIPQV